MDSFRVFVLLFIYCFGLAAAMAEVNISFGEFKIQHQDKITAKVFLDRDYSSRSLYKGLFGYGWCSSWDYRQDQNKKISLCLRTIEAPQTQLEFNSQGEIVEIKTSTQKIVFLRENENSVNVRRKTLSAKNIYIFLLKGVVTKIQFDGKIWLYQYQKHQLAKVISNKATLWQYEYDDYANMTLWRSQNLSEKMTYDNELDVIENYQQKDLCKNKYNYSFLNKSKLIFQTRKCLRTPAQTVKYSFDSHKKSIKIEVTNKPTIQIGEKNENSDSSANSLNL